MDANEYWYIYNDAFFLTKSVTQTFQVSISFRVELLIVAF